MAKKGRVIVPSQVAQKNAERQRAAHAYNKAVQKQAYVPEGATPLAEVKKLIEEKRKLGKKLVLHVGCGDKERGSGLHKTFQNDEWEEIRLDIEPRVSPDIVSDIRDMGGIPDESVDAIWSSHNIEHVFPHEVPQTMREFYRVIKVNGFMLIATPDMESVADAVGKKGLEGTLYNSPAGPISALDIMYGHIASIQRGAIFMAHKGAFTAGTLGRKALAVGARNIRIQRDIYNLTMIAYKVPEGAGTENLDIFGNDVNEMMRKRDEIDQEPDSEWKGLGFN